MNSIADMGGMDGFGPVVAEENEPTFHYDWERQVCVTNMAVWFGGAWCADETRHSMESMDPVRYLSTSYYEHWLHFMEELLVKKGVVTTEELGAGKLISSGPGSTLISKVAPETAVPAFRAGGSIAMPAQEAARFKEGDAVVVRNIHPPGHTRCPRFTRGKRGTVLRILGGFAFADTRAHGLGDAPQHVYHVRFEGTDLWGAAAGAKDAVILDMYDAYLDPA